MKQSNRKPRRKTIWCGCSNLFGKNEWCNRAARFEVEYPGGDRQPVCPAHAKELTAEPNWLGQYVKVIGPVKAEVA